MKHSLLIAEGIDDLRALHEIFVRQMGLEVQRQATPWFDPQKERTFARPGQERTVHVVYTNGRDPAAQLAQEYLKEGTVLKRGIDRMGLVFDPDLDSDEKCAKWICDLALKGLPTRPHDLGFWVDQVLFVPMAWDAGPPFDDLDDRSRNIERVALGVMQHGCPGDAALVLKLLGAVQAEKRKSNWKTALRLWNAVRAAEIEDSFFAKAFGQDRDLRASVRPILESTSLWRRLQLVVGAEEAPATAPEAAAVQR